MSVKGFVKRWKYTIMYTPIFLALVVLAVWWQIALIRAVL